MYKDGLHEHSRLEEEYFYKKERELIDNNKREAQQKKDLLERTSHYHKCAKCGNSMNELARENVTFLACHGCESFHMSLESMEALQQRGRLRAVVSDVRQILSEWKKSA